MISFDNQIIVVLLVLAAIGFFVWAHVIMMSIGDKALQKEAIKAGDLKRALPLLLGTSLLTGLMMGLASIFNSDSSNDHIFLWWLKDMIICLVGSPIIVFSIFFVYVLKVQDRIRRSTSEDE